MINKSYGQAVFNFDLRAGLKNRLTHQTSYRLWSRLQYELHGLGFSTIKTGIRGRMERTP